MKIGQQLTLIHFVIIKDKIENTFGKSLDWKDEEEIRNESLMEAVHFYTAVLSFVQKLSYSA